MKFAETELIIETGSPIKYDNNQFQGRARFQGSPLIDHGSLTPRESIQSFSGNFEGIA
jgi:hypothetical protein